MASVVPIPTPEPPPVPPPEPRGLVRLLAAIYRWAEAGWATTAVGTWTVLQGSFVPGPVDALFIPLGLADPPKVWRFAWAATVGSVLGALLAYAVGYFAFEELGRPMLALLGVSGTKLASVQALFATKGWMLVLLSTITPLSSKAVSVSAGALGVPLPVFVFAMAGGRAFRFFVTAAVMRFFGDRVERWIERKYGATLAELARRR